MPSPQRLSINFQCHPHHHHFHCHHATNLQLQLRKISLEVSNQPAPLEAWRGERLRWAYHHYRHRHRHQHQHQRHRHHYCHINHHLCLLKHNCHHCHTSSPCMSQSSNSQSHHLSLLFQKVLVGADDVEMTLQARIALAGVKIISSSYLLIIIFITTTNDNIFSSLYGNTHWTSQNDLLSFALPDHCHCPWSLRHIQDTHACTTCTTSKSRNHFE